MRQKRTSPTHLRAKLTSLRGGLNCTLAFSGFTEHASFQKDLAFRTQSSKLLHMVQDVRLRRFDGAYQKSADQQRHNLD